VEGFYLIVDLLLVVVLFVYVRALVRVLHGTVRWYPGRWYWQAIAGWREILVPVAILFELPALYHEAWPYLLTGDVGFATALIAALGLATALARTVFGLRSSAPTPPAAP
jgi:hypothetical protein